MSSNQIRKTADLLGRILILTIAYFIIFSAVSALLIPRISSDYSADSNENVLLALLLVGLLNTLILSYVILRSRMSGLRLMLSVFIVFFGVATFMPQIETAVFITRLTPGLLPRIVLSGLFVTLTFSILAVFLLGKYVTASEGAVRLQLSTNQWLARLAAIAICYVIIYFTFGYYVAWKNPAVRAYYGGGDADGFLVQMRTVFRDTPWLFLFQFFRGLLWAALGIMLIRLVKGRWWEIALVVALVFSVVMSSQLLIPNPLMPVAVRNAHLWETASSDFLLGLLVVLLIVKWPGRELSPKPS